MTIDRWILLVVTLIQLIHIIGRWTGKIDTNGAKNTEEIKKLDKTLYKLIQEMQTAIGKIGILETDVTWIKKLIDRRN